MESVREMGWFDSLKRSQLPYCRQSGVPRLMHKLQSSCVSWTFVLLTGAPCGSGLPEQCGPRHGSSPGMFCWNGHWPHDNGLFEFDVAKPDAAAATRGWLVETVSNARKLKT